MPSELMRLLDDPHARHAALVHFPIVLSLAGLLATAALAAAKFRGQTLRAVAIACFLGAAAGAGLAASAGEQAEERVEETAPTLSPAEEAALERHESLGENGWIWPFGAAALLVVTLSPKRWVRTGAGVCALAAALGVAVWAGLAGQTGGALVYEYGLGVPARRAGTGQTETPAPALPEGSTSRDHDED